MSEVGETPTEALVQTPRTQEVEKTSLDSILIFGQGPVIDIATREKAQVVGTQTGSEDINLWSESLAKAASELYKRKVMRQIIVMGGKTGGEMYKSEADLISDYLEKFGVPKQAIKRENRSTNTLENLVNVLNDYLDKDQSHHKDIGVLGANYHLPRIRLLMQLFHIPYKDAFSAEEVVRFVAREGEEWDNATLLELERRLDIDAAAKKPHPKLAPGYYPQKKGTEREDIRKRAQNEDVFTRYLLEIPENWLGYLARLSNRNRMREILKDQDQDVLKEKFQIDLNESDAEIVKKLLAITRDWPKDIGSLRGQDYPADTRIRLEKMIEKRRII
ncbi:MAG: YdcF family protein [Candidatus Levybacteria bacterium]|nr:YdcF family protein [Candidatus Levybacteria bacterium]MBI2190213.1 YdcF family protein [Candidatus Levybacteria bacterium]MBI2622943.1 YdcF family protein [Candidatus Levybacteria bacterium]MBI3070297.1 YdcF family protein [Candidatus Levybacteria bacterium]MBI3092675.1 YdcF family protein [Candidatus Levybacteria bacterium]